MTPEEERYRYLQLKSKATQMEVPQDPWANVAGMGGVGPDTIQEEHPEITWKDRLVVKNLATSPEATISYLKKEHPDLDIKTDPISGQVKVKALGESQYRVLDPDTGVFSNLKEFGKDIADVGYDVASGIGSGIATAAGGVAGALGGAGVGAIPGAMAAGAGSSAALEALRQGLGSAAGIEDNIDPLQIGVAGLAGGLSPALMGTGATAANIAGKGWAGKAGTAVAPELKATLERGLGRGIADIGAEAALQAQKGVPSRLLGKATEKLLPGFASKLSGVSKTDAEDLVKHADIVGKFESNPDAIEELANETMTNSLNKFRETETAAYKKVVEATGSEGIDVQDAIKPWLDKRRELAKAASAEGASPFQKTAFEEFKATMDDVWGSPKLDEPSFFTKTPEQFTSIQQRIAELADFDKGIKLKSKVADMSPAEKVIAMTSKNSYAGMNKSLEKVSANIPGLKKDLSNIIQAREFLHKKIGSPEQFISRMRQASGDKLENKMLSSKLKSIGELIGDPGLDEARGIMNAADKFGKSTPWLSTKRIPAMIAGTGLGYAANRAGQGQGQGFNMPGVTMGAAIGGALGGPRAVRAMLEAARRGGTGKIAPIVQLGAKPVWNMMMNNGNVEK